MLRTLLTRRWLTLLAAATAFAAVTVLLGLWQYSRHEERVAERDRVLAHYEADPVPVAEVTSASDPTFPDELDWTRVEAHGTYDGPQLLVRNRPHNGVFGYEIVVPLVVADGTAVLVDRGWVPNARSAATLPEVPPVPEGTVTVTGWLRPGEEDLGRDLPTGQLASIDPADAERQTGLDLAPAYLLMESEDTGNGTTPPRPAALPEPDTGLGSHFAYALQWWLTAPLGFAMVVVFARREHLEAAGKLPGRKPPVPARPGKVRIWDEEDE